MWHMDGLSNILKHQNASKACEQLILQPRSLHYKWVETQFRLWSTIYLHSRHAGHFGEIFCSCCLSNCRLVYNETLNSGTLCLSHKSLLPAHCDPAHRGSSYYCIQSHLAFDFSFKNVFKKCRCLVSSLWWRCLYLWRTFRFSVCTTQCVFEIINRFWCI